MNVEYVNGEDEVVYDEICEQITKREDDPYLGSERKVFTFRFKFDTRRSSFTKVIAVVAAVVIIVTSFMVTNTYWKQSQDDSYFALNDSSGYLTYLSKCSHSCGGGFQYYKRICNNTSSTTCDENKSEIQPCNTDPCPEPVNGSWSIWTLFSECSDTCGGGARYRTRECNNPSPAYGGLWCEGKDIEIEWCNTIRCISGSWSEWTSFTQCSVSCGGGLQSRHRKCDNPMPSYGGQLCEGKETENRLCSANICPGDGFSATNESSGHWIYLSECSKSCGGGIRYLQRVCDNTISMPCDEVEPEIQPCNADPCPDSENGSWSAWTAFSTCSDSCGGGARYRTRECNNPSPAYGGLWCNGKDLDIDWCNTIGCPLNGSWGEWTTFSYCSHTCGGGMKYRVRECENPSPAFGGEWCAGNDTDIAFCNVEGCPVNGSWSEWTSFTQCSVSCGGGVQSRIRRCNNPSPENGGKQCEGKEKERRPCNTDVCPVHGEWESWVPVTECSRYSGGGTQYRIRKCNNPGPAFGGTRCPGNDTSIKQCPVNGGWGDWGSYSSCSRTCGSGSQTRYRSCVNPSPAFGGAACSGSGSETQSCNTYPCPVNGGWSTWSSLTSCSQSCGGGFRYYIRRCTRPKPAYGGSWCHGGDYDSFSCNTQSCPGPTYELSIIDNYMTTPMGDWVIQKAKQALIKFGSTYEAAKYVCQGLREKYSDYWYCMIGSKGSCHIYGWYEPSYLVRFYLGKIYISVQKSPKN